MSNNSDLLVCGYIRSITVNTHYLFPPKEIVQFVGLFYPIYRLISNVSHSSIPLNIVENPQNIYYYKTNQFITHNESNQVFILFNTTNNALCVQLQSQLFRNIKNDNSYKITSINDKSHSQIPTIFALKDGEIYRFPQQKLQNNNIPKPLKNLNKCVKTSDIFMNDTNVIIKQIIHSPSESMLLLTNKHGKNSGFRRLSYMKSGQFINGSMVPYDVIKIVACINEQYFLLTKYQKLYSFGPGNLALSVINRFFQSKNIINVICGHYHSCVIDENYQCFMFGSNKYGQCGDGTDGTVNPNIAIPIHIQEIHKYMQNVLILDACLGGKHSVLMGDSDCLYVFGDNSHQQISINCKEQILIPLKLEKSELGIDKSEKIVKIIADACNTYFIVESFAKPLAQDC